MSKAKIVGFITIILIISLLVFWAFKIVDNNKKKAMEEALYLKYEKQNITVSLNGNYLEYLSLGDEYIEKGVKAITDDGKDVSDDVLITYYKEDSEVSDIDTQNITNYLVKYTAVDPKTDKGTSIYKTIIIKED